MGLVTLPGLKELNLLGVKDLYHSLCFDSTLNLHQQYCTWVFYDNIKQRTGVFLCLVHEGVWVRKRVRERERA